MTKWSSCDDRCYGNTLLRDETAAAADNQQCIVPSHISSINNVVIVITLVCHGFHLAPYLHSLGGVGLLVLTLR